jgi:hypothetical protein
MPYVQTLPLLLSVLVGLAIGLVTWGFLREREGQTGSPQVGMRDEILLGLFALAAFASGVFITIILLTLFR